MGVPPADVEAGIRLRQVLHRIDPRVAPALRRCVRRRRHTNGNRLLRSSYVWHCVILMSTVPAAVERLQCVWQPR